MTLTTPRYVLLGMLPLLASCNLLTPIVFVGEHRKQFTAEFDKLANKRAVVLVYTDPSTLFDYPHARFELATFVADKLDSEMTTRKLSTDVVDPRDVEDYLQRNLGAQIDPQMVGKEFKADYVVFLEVVRFQIRDPRQPQFLQGLIESSVCVHQIGTDPDLPDRFELAPVTCTYPDGAPILISGENSALVREATYRKFAEMVARKFYEHTREL